jgi:hypothetical protein
MDSSPSAPWIRCAAGTIETQTPTPRSGTILGVWVLLASAAPPRGP